MGKLRKIWALGVLGLMSGCTIDNAFLEKIGIPPPNFDKPRLAENPLFVALRPEERDKVFETVFSVLDNYGFDILESNRHDGRIETAPRIAPGLGLYLKPGSPDFHERALATLQTYRHRVSVLIQYSKEKGSMFIDVRVRKELEMLARPVKTTVGDAIFRTDNNIERYFDVVDDATPASGWLYRGRDPAMEQEIIRQIRTALGL